MPNCYSCDKPVSNVRQSNGQYRKFCNRKCYIKWTMANKGVKQCVAERHKDHKVIAEAMAKALKGDTEAKVLLRRKYGVRGLWNPKTQRMVRW